MKKFLALTLTTGLLLTACGTKEPEQSPAEVLLEATQNGLDVTSGEYNFEVMMTADLGEEGELSLDATMEGAFDLGEDLMFSLATEGNLLANAGGENLDENFKGEVRLVDNTVYFMLEELSDFDGEIPAEVVEQFLGQWQYVESPVPLNTLVTQFLDEMKATTPQTVEEIEAMYSELNYEGTEGGNYVYSFVVDGSAMAAFVEGFSSEFPLSDSEMEEVMKLYENMELTGTVMIDAEEMVQTGAEMVASLKDFEGADLDFVVSYTMENHNGDVEVEVPEDAVEFALPGLF